MTLYLGDRANIEERSYFRKLIVQADKLGLKAIVFTPQDVDGKNRRIRAHVYDTVTGKWSRSWRPFPQIIYDRCRYQPTERFRQFRRFRATYTNLLYLNRPIANKWGIYQFLYQSPRIRPHLPATRVYESHGDLLGFLRGGRKLVYLKPINGTGGRGILRLERKSNGTYLLQGRDSRRRIIAPKLVTARQLPQKLAAWHVKGRYLIQQGIPSRLPDGRVFDFRLLIQKNGNGEWEVTGCAGRVGPKMSITSNLHGGGQAVPMAELLGRIFPEDRIESIRTGVYELGEEVARAVEGHYGRLCELGIDIAIDPDGHPWLLELNPKPAREVFARIGEKETYEKAITRPLEYALWLYRQNSDTSVSRRKRRLVR